MRSLPRRSRDAGPRSRSRWSLRRPSLPRWTAAAFLLLPAVSQGAERLSLPEAVRLAEERSPIVGEARAQGEAARQAKREAWLERLPAVQVRQLALRTDSPADAFGLQLNQERFSFPAFMAGDPNDPDDITNYATEIEATMPLFTGGKLGAGIGQASRMSAAADATATHTRAAVALQVADAYRGVLLADRFLELATKARETTARHVEQAQAYLDVGMIVESDLLQAKVQLAKMEEFVITSESNVRLARAGLNRAMGVEQHREFELDPELPPPPLPAETLEEALDGARQRRQDLQAAGARVEAARLGVRRAAGEYFPEIAISARYSLNDENFLGDHGQSYTLMAMARWDVWNWGQTQARVSRSKSERTAAEEARRAYEQQVELEVRQAWQDVGGSRARLAVAVEAVTRAERALAILDDRFRQGVARVTDLLDAETMLNEARARDLNARFDLDRAIRTLNFATGLSPVPEVS